MIKLRDYGRAAIRYLRERRQDSDDSFELAGRILLLTDEERVEIVRRVIKENDNNDREKCR